MTQRKAAPTGQSNTQINPKMGGAPGVVIASRNKYTDYVIDRQSNGMPSLSFKDWAKGNMK